MADRALTERLIELLAHPEPAQRRAGRELLASLDGLAPAEVAEIEVEALHKRMAGGLRAVAESVEQAQVQDAWLLVSPDLGPAVSSEASLVASPRREGARRVAVVEGAPGPSDLIVPGIRMVYSTFTGGEQPLLLFGPLGQGRRAWYTLDAPRPAPVTIVGDEYAHQSHRQLLQALGQHIQKKKRKAG